MYGTENCHSGWVTHYNGDFGSSFEQGQRNNYFKSGGHVFNDVRAEQKLENFHFCFAQVGVCGVRNKNILNASKV